MNLLITEYNFSANRFVAAVTFKQNFFNRYLKMKINLSFYYLVLTLKEIEKEKMREKNNGSTRTIYEFCCDLYVIRKTSLNIVIKFRCANQWTGFYMIGTFAMKEIKVRFSTRAT